MPISPSSLNGYEFTSVAEKKIYESASESKYFDTSERYLFHSLNIFNTGNKKVKGEIDFVYLDNECLLFLEVKGGQIKFDSLQNKWYVMGGTQQGDPFKQAYNSLFHVRDKLLPDLFKSKSISNRLVFGIGVIFPDSLKPQEFTKTMVDSMEYDPELIYDYGDHSQKNGFQRYIDRLKSYWALHPQFKDRLGISQKETITISKYFRQDLHFKLPICDLLKKGNLEAHRFTGIQMYVLDNIAYNPGKSNIIMGGPGTGKTLLALELLRRHTMAGKRVLLICYNKNLATYLRTTAVDTCVKEFYEIRNLHELLRDESFLNVPLEPVVNHKEYWSRDLPLFFTKNIKEIKKDIYDYIIIDEGQDILNEYQMEAIGKLVKGGLNSGNWIVFMDMIFQNIYNSEADKYFEYLRTEYSAIVNTLPLNCRNTVSTVKRAALETGLPEMPCLRTDQVWNSEIRYHHSGLDLYNKLSDKISRLREEGVLKEQITILCFEKDQVLEIINSDSRLFIESAFMHHGKINVCTIHSFKGLENEFILIIGPQHYDPDNNIQMYLIYIANTRASSQSVFFLERGFKSIIDDREDQNI